MQRQSGGGRGVQSRRRGAVPLLVPMVLVGVIVSAVVFLNYVIAADRGLGENLRASLTVMVADVRHDMRDVVGASCLISLMPLFYQVRPATKAQRTRGHRVRRGGGGDAAY